MRRILYLLLPNWPIDRLRRAGLLPGGRAGGAPGDPAEPPFATVSAAGGRQVLAAVNPAAAGRGLAAGMTLADALSFLPGLATHPAESAADAAALRRLAEWCGRYSPWTAPDHATGYAASGVMIETAGSAHLWGGEAALAVDLSARLARQGIFHRLAIADTPGAAWGVARFAATGEDAAGEASAIVAPVIVMPGATRTALAPLPIAALRLAADVADGLCRVGLTRIGDVLAMPRDALARRFGDSVAGRLDQALGDAPEPLSPLGEVPSRRVRLSLAEPIADPADLARAAERLTRDLVTRLAREGTGARRLGLAFFRVDGRIEQIRLGTVRPSRDPVHLAKLLVGQLDTVDPGLGIEDLILAAYAVEPLMPEQRPLPLTKGEVSPGTASPRPIAARRDGENRSTAIGGDIAPLLDRLGGRLGLAAVARLAPHASHIPERASMAVPVGAGPRRDALPDPRPPATAPRPLRLFAPPEPIEAFWVMPDDPPFRFAWRRRPYRVIRADGPERIAEEWWRPDGRVSAGAGAADAIRDYYRVEDETGRRFWLFRAGLPGNPPPRWFIHGLFA